MKASTAHRITQTLEKAYIAACKGLGIANKLSDKSHKARILGNMNRIRSELRKYSRVHAFENVAYRGCIESLLPVNIPKFLTASECSHITSSWLPKVITTHLKSALQ